MWWYLSDLARFKRERLGLETLATEADWLTPIDLRTDDTKRLVLNADIKVGERTFPVFLRYPEHFPHTPPSVYPRGDTTRWTTHQFGPGGELCLEYGPDNWTSDVTGAQLLESAYRLLSAENNPTGEKEVVPSRHDVSIGQRLRSVYSRLLVTRLQTAFLAGVPLEAKMSAKALINFRSESNVYLIDKVTLPDGEVWRSDDMPKTLAAETFERPLTILRIADNAALPPTSSVAEFRVATLTLGLQGDEPTVVILRGDGIHGFLVLEQSVVALTSIPAQDAAQRLDDAHAVLRTKSVSIIGCGSLGSKIATMLARSGVCDFYLVDDDLLLPDNLVRHDLDWRDIGSHKAEAVAQKIRHVNPEAKVYVRQVRMAGQEASASADTALDSLTRRDLIIDATANANVFNLVSSIAVSSQKPMVWAQLYGGGFGGLVARYRPELEPPPPMMRRAIENWFGEKNYKPKLVARDYATGGEGPPLIADDADVSSIAAPTARMVIDTLIGRVPSFFPASAYVIGLAPEPGLFTQAFETYPIDMPPAPASETESELSSDDAKAEIDEIVKIFGRG